MSQVSIIIALYNEGRYIRRTLDSVCAQTFDDCEVIVVDDGSTDDGPDIVKSYADSRVHLIRQENAGPGAARNRGVKESTAPFLAFIDADDEWLPDFLRVSMEALEGHPECAVSVTSRFKGHPREDVTDRLRAYGLKTGAWFLHENHSLASLKHARAMFSTGAVVCRRDVFVNCGGFYDRTRTISGEDTYLWLQFLANCGIFMILRPLVWYHSEASELGCRWADAGVVQPYLSDPESIRKNCPPVHRRLLEELLTGLAFCRASALCERGDVESARKICRMFPLMKRSLWRYTRLRMRMDCPRLYRLLRHARMTSSCQSVSEGQGD